MNNEEGTPGTLTVDSPVKHHQSPLSSLTSSCPASPKQSPVVHRRKLSASKFKQREEFFKKYSPLTSTDLFIKSNQSNVCRKQSALSFLDPNGTKAYNWLLVVGVAVVYFTWSIVARISFAGIETIWYVWLLLDFLCGVIYIIDVLIQSRTSFLKDGILEEAIDQIVNRYTQSWEFYVDIISAIPFDWLYILRLSYPPLYLHLPKLLKFYRLKQFFSRTESRTHFPNTSRAIFLLHNMVMVIHWNACIYFSFSQHIGFGSDSWVYPAWNTTESAEWGDASRQYIYSLYWSTLTLTTIGELPQPQTNTEYMFVICDYLIGILMFATIVGNVGNIITNTQKNKAKFQTKMDNIKVYMKNTNVPEHLREKVIKWFDYLWTHGHPVNDQHVLNTLPDKLKAEIGIYVHFETLKKVDFFSACEQGLLWELVVSLRTQVYSPGEYVCRKGDVGREMYIVNSGKLEVMAEEDGTVLREMKEGEYFGEISVLNLGTGKGQRRRTAFVRSVGFSTLLCLSQSDLLDVLKDYPETMHMLLTKGKKRLSRDVVQQSDSSLLVNEYSNHDSDNEIEPENSLFFKRCNSSASTTSTSDLPPTMHTQTIADRVSDLHTRMDKIEEILSEVLHQVKQATYKQVHVQNDTPAPTISSKLYSITERIRKVSSQF